MVHTPQAAQKDRNMNSSFEVAKPHAILFPFMSKGHIIPLIHLSHLLIRHHGVRVTFITTPSNRRFITATLSDTTDALSDTAAVVELPFPKNIPDIPAGVENTEKLPSQTLLAPFANGTKLMQPHFENALRDLLPVTFVISDGFLGWTLESASKFNVPRLAIFGTNKYLFVVSKDASENNVFAEFKSDNEMISLPSFPWIKLTKNDFDPRIREEEPKAANEEFVTDLLTTTSRSFGVLVNTFYELESPFVDYWNNESRPRAYCVGPLCLANPLDHEIKTEKPKCLDWLDKKLSENKHVLYVAFGSQCEMSKSQFKELETGLEKSNVNFLWVMKETSSYELEMGFEERVKERGIIVKEWVNQMEILEHESVKGFLSHCGWNSCLESICACVPMLAFPLMNDQHLNTRFVVEEIKIALRVEVDGGFVRGFVKWEGLVKMVRELMEGEMGIEARKKVIKVGKVAKMAMGEGGSSRLTLDMLVDELCYKKI